MEISEKPLAIDLFCGLGGWAEGLLAEGWRVIGYDIEEHRYGDLHYPADLVLRDVLTIHGSEFKDADLIVASPPCQEYSYMAMPWSRAKAIAADYRSGRRDKKKLTALFDACFRIQREASEAAGRYIPMIVENVRGAQPWVGKARWNFGSYYLWGDVPALMPITQSRRMKSKISCAARNFSDRVASTPEEAHALHYRLPDGVKAGDRNIGAANGEHKWSNSFADHFKSSGMNCSDQTKRGEDFTRLAGEHCGLKGVPHKPNGHWTNPAENGVKQAGISGTRKNGKGDRWFQDGAARAGSKSNARKAASAMIAKIPFPLSNWIAKAWKPK